MKKFLIAVVVLLGSISLANAERFRVGIAVMGAGFEADGAKEIFSGDHSSNTTSTKVTKNTSAEKEDAEGVFALGSVFGEVALNDQISLGVNYVPHSSDSEETENIHGYTIALGYQRDLADGMFVRAEAAYMDIDGTTLTNTNDATKSVSADGITGYGAAVSVGKSF